MDRMGDTATPFPTSTEQGGATARVARWRRRSVALVVGLVLADSSVVILALPAIYREFGAEVAHVAWVITAFNLTLAAAAVPAAALVPRVGANRLCALGLAGFGAASLACALAPSLGVLIGARAVQGLSGAAAVCAALELLPAVSGGEAGAARSWAVAGVVGAAVGPAIGGLLTEALSWQTIFIVQVPLAMGLISLIGLRGARTRPEPTGRPHVAANVALALLSAGLTAALFLLVLLLIEGWRLSPIAAAAVVSVLPAASILTGPFEGRVGQVRTRVAAGAIVGSGGLAALGLMPGSGWWWTVPAQVLVGIGLALALGGLTDAALAGRSRPALHGGVTIASRHAGIVLGLLLLTPVFVGDLDRQRGRAEQRGLELVLDSRIAPTTKLALADVLTADLRREPGRLPDIRRSFAKVDPEASDRAEFRALATRLGDQLDRAATSSFSRSFLLAALLAVLGLVPVAMSREVRL
jgi:predicted MFS family arabinose efflux permease